MSTLEQIRNNKVYKQILSDSFGGIMYNVADYGKYDTTELVKLWDSLSSSEKEATGGIMKGAFNFIREGAKV